MELKKAIEILKSHNEWRRDKDEISTRNMADPKLLGEAIDVVTGVTGNGVVMVTNERDEQINKHGRTVEHDLMVNSNFELSRLAQLLLTPETDEIRTEEFPDNWEVPFLIKMIGKPYEKRLVIAGALICAEIDRCTAEIQGLVKDAKEHIEKPDPVCHTCLKTKQEAAGKICSSVECNRYRGTNKSVEIAEILDGLEYGTPIQPRILEMMNEHGVVVAWGQSDDLLELVGPIDDELGCYDGGKFMVFHPQDSHGSGVAMAVTNKNYEGKKNIIEAVWCPKKDGEIYASWLIKSTIPHHPFDVFEDGELFCRAIAFNVSDLKRLEE